MCGRTSSGFGMFRGTLRRPSMSSENAISFVGRSLSCRNARRMKVVRATSANVPMWGKPEGP